MAFITSIPLQNRQFITQRFSRTGPAHERPQPQQSVRPAARPSRVVRMELLSHEKREIVSETPEGEQANYHLKVLIPGPFSKAKRRETIQEMKKNASFKGFRKGTIPPFIMKDVPAFILRDCADELLLQAVNELGLNTVDEQEATLDVDDMLSGFEVGTDFEFECDVVLQSLKQEAIDVDVNDLEEIVSVSEEDRGPGPEEDAARMKAAMKEDLAQ